MSSKADVKARVAHELAADLPPGLSLVEQAELVVDDLIRRDLVAEYERDDWVAKTRKDLER